jgi:hypothetical protein
MKPSWPRRTKGCLLASFGPQHYDTHTRTRTTFAHSIICTHSCQTHICMHPALKAAGCAGVHALCTADVCTAYAAHNHSHTHRHLSCRCHNAAGAQPSLCCRSSLHTLPAANLSHTGRPAACRKCTHQAATHAATVGQQRMLLLHSTALTACLFASWPLCSVITQLCIRSARSRIP